MALDPVLVENTVAWLKKAALDCRRAGRCLADQPPDFEDAVFHCQQAAEKALKAFLTWHDQPFKKTHDLAALGSQCKEIDGSFEPLIDRLDDLTQYAWIYRYPTSLAEPSASEAEEASTLAGMILTEIMSRLPPEVRKQAGG